MQTTPIEFTGWDAYKYTPLKGTFEVRISGTQRWVEFDGDSMFNCSLTYRFTPEDTRTPIEIAAQAAAENRYESDAFVSSFIAGFKEGAIWLARERNEQEAQTATMVSWAKQEKARLAKQEQAREAGRRHVEKVQQADSPLHLDRHPDKDITPIAPAPGAMLAEKLATDFPYL